MNRRVLRLSAGVVVAGALALGGCGGGDDDPSTTAASAGATATAPLISQAPSDGSGATEKSKGGGSGRSFTFGSPADVPRSQGGDNSIQDFGSEAGGDDRAAAARALAAYYEALASGDTEAACALLSNNTRQDIEHSLDQLDAQGGRKVPSTCPQILKLTGNADKSPELQISEVLSLRQQDDHAFLIYTAADRKVYAMVMAREDGDWRVAGVHPAPLGA